MATRANATAKNATHIKPAEFTGIKDRTNRLDANLTDVSKRATGIYTVGVLRGRSGINKDTLRPIDLSRFVKTTGIQPDASDIRERYKFDYPEFANIPDNRIIVLASRPKIEFNTDGSLSMPNTQHSLQEMIRQFVADCKNIQEETLTVKNIAEIIQNSTYAPTKKAAADLAKAGAKGPKIKAQRDSDKRKQTPLLASILKNYISNPDSGERLYPMQVVPNVSMLPRDYKIAVSNAVAVDFAEIISPLACVTGNITGNASRIIKEFLNVKSIKELMQRATIHFNPGTTDPMVDSFIHCVGGDNRARVIGISTKGNPGGSKPTSGTAANALAVAIDEIKTNPTALQLLNKLLRDPENRRMFDIVSVFSDKVIGSKYEKTLRLLQLLDSSYSKSEMFSDIKFARSLGNSEPGRNTYTRFSSYIQARIRETPLKRGKEEGDESPFRRFMRSSNNKIADILNGEPKFSETCAWILNHSATIQVDLYTSREVVNEARTSKNYGKSVVITNVVATWPSTRTDTVKVLKNAANDDLRFILDINGYAQKFPERAAKQEYSDTDYRDIILAQHGDRDGSNLKTAADWSQQRGINGPRTTVDLHDLPRNNGEPKQSNQSKQNRNNTQRTSRVTPQTTNSGELAKYVTTFLNNWDILNKERGMQYVTDYILGANHTRLTGDFITAFKSFVNDNPSIRSLIEQHSREYTHPVNTGEIFESVKSDEMALDIASVLYWSLLLRKYAATGNTNHANYSVIEDKIRALFEQLGANVSRRNYLEGAFRRWRRYDNRATNESRITISTVLNSYQ